MQPDKRSKWFGLSQKQLEKKAAWLSEQRNLPDRPAYFFIEAGKLVSFSWYQYSFATHAFFQAVIGLEASLNLMYPSSKMGFKGMFADVVKKELVTDEVLSEIEIPKNAVWLVAERKKRMRPKPRSHVELMSQLVPDLRNEYFHGSCLLAPDFLQLTFQMRELADALSPEIKRK